MQSNNMCRFCLKLVHGVTVELINRVMKNKLAVLLIKLELDVSEDPVACKICLDILDEIYIFKSKCLHLEDIIRAHFESNIKDNLSDILIKLGNGRDVNIAGDEMVCRLCTKIPLGSNYVALNKTSEEVSHYRDMIQMHLPEINLNVTEQPVTCEACHILLKKYLSFAICCMDVEQKIKMYCEHQETDVKEHVDLIHVLKFTENKAKDCENTFNGDLVIKHEDRSVIVKIEKVELVEKDNLSEDHFTDGSRTEFYIKEEEVEIKSEDDQISMDLMISDQLDGSGRVGNNGFPKKKSRSRIRKDTSRDKTEFCPKYPDMGSHSHEKLSKCCLCPFTAYNQSSLRIHMTSHKGPTNMFSCTECTYETHMSYRLARHVLKHKNKLEVETYKCSLCPYESKSRETLRKHQRFQHDENIKMYECKECTWNTKYSGSYVRHQLSHKMDNSKKNSFSCDQCTYSTHARYNLLSHKHNRHKCESSTRPNVILQCNQCDFCTKWSNCLRLHKKTHDPAAHLFKCEQCEYCTFDRSRLNRHLLTHMKLGEVVVYYCATCDFKSKHKDSLRSHMKICLKKKDDRSSRVMLQCSHCDFQTINRTSLSRHRKVHDPAIPKFKCEQCEYCTYVRSSFNKHLLTHMDLGEAVVYDCVTCDFKTKYKYSLTYHMRSCSKKDMDDEKVQKILSS